MGHFHSFGGLVRGAVLQGGAGATNVISCRDTSINPVAWIHECVVALIHGCIVALFHGFMDDYVQCWTEEWIHSCRDA